jgi:hypothetical protein
LVLLFALTAADYVLWDWSIANTHDIVSLVSGLTLLPLAALTLGGLAIGGARLLRLLLGGAAGRRASVRASLTTEPERHARSVASERDASDRLAA